MSSTMLYAGAARQIINPPLGIGKIGTRLFADPIQAIESDLTATAVVFGNGQTKVAILAADLCHISSLAAREIRSRIGQVLGIPISHVMLNFSHNHSSPAMPEYSQDEPDQARLKQRYLHDLSNWLVQVATAADRQLRPARVGTGWGESHIGVYRREIRNGRDVLGEVPDHPIDASVGVVRVDDLDGQPIATLFRYSCHPVTVGPRSMVASTDFPGPAREVIERGLGGLALFLQGCGGNINPAVGIGYEVDCRDSKRRVGAMLGGEALRVAAGIRTHVQAGARKPLGNIPNILFRPWEAVTENGSAELRGLEEVVALEYGPLPSLGEAEGIAQEWATKLAARRAQDAPEWEIRVASKFERWARGLVEAVKEGHPTFPLNIQGVRIGEVVVAGLNVEVFYETGEAIRGRSGAKETLVLGYTNGSLSYLPRAEDYPAGGWKLSESYAVPDLIFQAYEQPVAFEPGSEKRAVDCTLDLINRLMA